MKLKGLLIICVLTSSISVDAQSGGSAAAGESASVQQAENANAAALRSGFKEVADWVTKSADMVPAEKYNYKPVETVRTFGQLIGHIADSYNYYCALGAGNKVEWSDPIEKGTTDKATLIPKLKQTVEKCNAAYSSSAGQVGPLLTNVGHTNLHYGNIITYMRMLGLKPPSS
jgi:uncharacterized damage-inducible protein DinB